MSNKSNSKKKSKENLEENKEKEFQKTKKNEKKEKSKLKKLNYKNILIKILKTLKVIFLIIIAILLVLSLISFFLNKIKTPSNDKEWNKDQKVLSFAEFNIENRNIVDIYNIRNINYRNKTDFDVSYYNKTVNLDKLKTLDYMVEDLEGFPGFAHTLLSFGFEDGTYIVISVEIRKEIGETYHPISGLMAKYELMYVIGDEKDLINLRANYRNDSVYLYPIDISQESLRNLFISMLETTNELIDEPRFYNTFSSTCTTNLAKEASKSTNEKFLEFHPYILLPGYSDKILLKNNLIKTEIKNREELKEHFNINKLAREYQFSSDFSKGIRSKR